ncbi:MAG: hypothetical protein PVJ57_02340 [Phycisphaerae bacterium]|jgi:hypothetical protein
MNRPPDTSDAGPSLPLTRVTIAVLLVGTLLVSLALSPRTALIATVDGVYVLLLLLAAAGWGAWPARGLRGEPGRPGRELLLAIALGLGIMAPLALLLGMNGALTGPTTWALLAGGGGLGLVRIVPALTRPTQPDASPSSPRRNLLWSALPLLALCPLLGMSLFGATLPPGILWPAEARGYDVLEYHLQAPREYYEDGHFTFLPYNVYASFPQQVEILYLLLMYMMGGPLSAAIAAQLLHLALGVLAVAAPAAWSPPGWPRTLVALVAGGVTWMAYLGCLAYVELGLLFFAAVAGGIACRQADATAPGGWRGALAAGLCAGLAGGCKYTALILVAAGLGFAWLIAMRADLRTRAVRALLFGVGVIVAFSPWLIRNAVQTGNPVYPFAYHEFGGAAWSDEQAAQWSHGHRIPADKDSVTGRAQILADELFVSPQFGPALWLVPAIGLLAFPRRRHWLTGIWLIVTVAAWATLTHMPGRFAVPIIVPLALMLGSIPETGVRGWRRTLLIVLLVCAAGGAVWNGTRLLRALGNEDAHWRRLTGAHLRDLVGATEARAAADPINLAIPDAGPTTTVWLVGDAAVFYVQPRCHYTVTFSRDPWLTFAESGATAPECVDWLRSRNVTHVVFSWSEVDRLRDTYGFSPVVTPAWVEQLEQAGLERVITPDTAPSMAVYEVPAE